MVRRRDRTSRILESKLKEAEQIELSDHEGKISAMALLDYVDSELPDLRRAADEIDALQPDDDDDEQVSFRETLAQFSIRIRKLRLKLPSHQEERHSSGDHTNSYDSNRSVKLPNIELQTFHGDPLKFLEFDDAFKACVDTDPKLPAVRKFQYLKRYLDGEPREMLDGLSLTASNYVHAQQLLHERYGSTERLIAAHMKALWELQGPDYNVGSITRFYDQMVSHTRALSSLGKSEAAYGDLVVSMLLERLPTQLAVQIHRDRKADSWTLRMFKQAINSELQALKDGCKYGSLDTIPPGFSTASFFTPVPSNQTQRYCPFCKNGHRAIDCQIVIDPKKRRDIATRDRLCFNCLGSRHGSKNCRSRFTCATCHLKHHSALHGAFSDATSMSTTGRQSAAPGTSPDLQITTPTPLPDQSITQRANQEATRTSSGNKPRLVQPGQPVQPSQPRDSQQVHQNNNMLTSDFSTMHISGAGNTDPTGPNRE